MSKFRRGLLVEILGGVISAIIIALLFFVLSDFVFSPPNMNGKWFAVTKINQTNHSPYQDMILVHEVYVYQDKEAVSGRGEKIQAITNSKNTELYKAGDRIHSELNGAINRNFIRKDILHLHLIENGTKRISNVYYELARFDDNYMFGRFESSVAASNGVTEWVRDLKDLKEIRLPH